MYDWVDLGDGRQVYRKVDTTEYATSSLPRPMIMSDHIETVQSMADGRYYSSKAALRATYKPSGNPSGESFVEVGTEFRTPRPKPKPKADTKGITDAINKARGKLGLL